ncbi:uncharacterized protein B0H18DRAFT_968611 [Fomitopsis serialis]|uniref:uncharacterized protein n=1 Tax=Fomitopsis serialis TaxID=139415 RepID=UPI0020080DB6|nr:uncharacterized protein B0H18DRAFT_968611 [Neoantrodia serialis]KAH9936977.1 hypothetical protein B0H18DRAFT_968611 [Neoantrodia serialis]
MYQVTDDLGLTLGKRYDSAVICACARGADGLGHATTEEKWCLLANALSTLASTWMAYMLWPFVCGSRRTTLPLEIPTNRTEQSDNATPTRETTASELPEGAPNAREDVREKARTCRDDGIVRFQLTSAELCRSSCATTIHALSRDLLTVAAKPNRDKENTAWS